MQTVDVKNIASFCHSNNLYFVVLQAFWKFNDGGECGWVWGDFVSEI